MARFVSTPAFSQSLQRRIRHQLGREWGRVVNDVDGLVLETMYRAYNKLGPKVVYSIAQGRGFNSYTGAMAYSYGAAFILDGKHIGNFIMEDGDLEGVTPPPATIRFTVKRNRAYAHIQGRRKHMNVSRYIRLKYTYKRNSGRPTQYRHKKYLRTRFLKRGESMYGYHKGLFHKNLSMAANYVPYKRRTGSSMERLFTLQVYNVDPFAQYVQNKGYDVIAGGRIRGRARHMKRVVADISADMVYRALHNYKKDYSRMQTGRYTGSYGRVYNPGREEWN